MTSLTLIELVNLINVEGFLAVKNKNKKINKVICDRYDNEIW
jgi:hypothetical protein